jgi:hypothetical protein
MTKHSKKSNSADGILAHGGGNATAAGVSFQAKLGAWLASHLLAERPLDANLTGKRLRSLRFETEAPVDDIMAETEWGWLFFQAKTGLKFSDNPESDLAKTVDQFVRQWLACSTGDGSRGWNRPLQPDRDRIVLALGPGTSRSLSADLAQGLAALQKTSSAPLPQSKADAVRRFSGLLERAWRAVTGKPATTMEIQAILGLVTILTFDLDGADQRTGTEILSHIIDTPEQASTTFSIIAQHCQEFMQQRTGFDMLELRRALTAKRVALAAQPTYREDVKSLRMYSERIRKQLGDYETTKVAGAPIRIDRKCTGAVMDAARVSSLLLVGEPGAGKSAVINASASKLGDEGYDVIELAVDRLPVKSLPELAAELGLSHPLREVLINWPGDQPAFLFIDALDATRGGENEMVLRTLIEDVLSFETHQWHIVASIRTFDLRLGEQFRRLFSGSPPNKEFADAAFPGVVHIHVPPWTSLEFSQLLREAPMLAEAIDTGGTKLRELALVPFNTRLLADLISGGLAPTAFGEIQSQVQLLGLYWNHRVGKHGTAAELCIEAAVTQMIESRSLQARKLDVARPDALTFDALLHENVLVLQEQSVAFRHHVLFDYAASRVYIRTDDLGQTADLLKHDKGLGFMLAPALGFAIQQLWSDPDDGHRRFWMAIRRLTGDAGCDPIARSVSARAAAELPLVSGDAIGLFTGPLAQGDSKTSLVAALSHVVGALVVRFDDNQQVSLDPWCELARIVSERVEDTAWPLRTLLYALYERVISGTQRAQLGYAARKLLRYCLDSSNTMTRLTASAIDFVAVTYASDVKASRQLLDRLFEPTHFKDRADQELPWLTRRLGPISEVDPDFITRIYAATFASSISDGSTTSIGDSQIFHITSNRPQDYEHSWWNLKEFFPHFLKTHPLCAVRALIGAIQGYVARAHPVPEYARSWSIPTPVYTVRLQEDQSHIWAWDINEERGDCAHGLVRSFVKHLEEVEADVARTMVQEIIECNELGLIWARMLMAASKRVDVVGDMLWPIATEEPFLISSDTQKDAIDFIAARYPFEDTTSRARFELRAIDLRFEWAKQPENASQMFLRKLFSCVGEQNLVTAEARAILPKEEADAPSIPNNMRPFSITTGVGPPKKWWWLERDGVDLKAPEVVRILNEIDEITKALGLENREDEIADIDTAIGYVKNMVEMAYGAQGLPESVVAYAYGVAAQGVAKLSRLPVERLLEQEYILPSLIALVTRLAQTPAEPFSAEQEANFESSISWGSPNLLIDTAEALMRLCRLDGDIVEELRPTMEMLLGVQNPAARLQISDNLTVLWNSARSLMWELANRVAQTEPNRGVLRGFANSFLGSTIHADPERVEQLVFILHGRDFYRAEKATQLLFAEIGSLIALLWITHCRPKPRETLWAWVSDPHSFEAELGHAISVSGGAIVLKYQEKDPADAGIAERAQEFFAGAVSAMAEGLERCLDEVHLAQPTENEKEHCTLYAKFLNQLCDQIYFAAGAFRSGERERHSLESDEAKRSFLSDMEPLLARIADIGTPGTIHRLIELLDFLVPADPAVVFDLVAHALLGAGRRYGYQFESLGATRFVEIVGHYLADHRDLFVDENRRQKLVACLDIFMEAGWPAARRLVYRLPELLQ